MLTTGKQQGSVLLISLMLLVILTLMTFAISNSVLLQGKMTGSIRDDTLALQVAEFALSDAERFVNDSDLSHFTLSGDRGLYDGQCDTEDADCVIKEFAGLDLFADSAWTDDNSRPATTPIACPFGNACPVNNNGFQPGRFKIILMGNIDLTLSGAERISSVTNQYQDQGEGAVPEYVLYRVIATGTGVDSANRRVIVSHFSAPVESAAAP